MACSAGSLEAAFWGWLYAVLRLGWAGPWGSCAPDMLKMGASEDEELALQVGVKWSGSMCDQISTVFVKRPQ